MDDEGKTREQLLDELCALRARLPRSEALLAEAEQLARLGSWQWDLSDDSVIWSAETCRLFGFEPGTFAGTFAAFLARVHPDDRARVVATNEQALRDRLSFERVFRVVHPDGAVRVIQGRGRVISDALGNAVRMVGTCQDVTERAQAEEELRRQAERLEALSRRLVQVQEEERRHIAREVHDEIGQGLTALQLILERAAREPRDTARHALDEARAMAREVLAHVRELSLDLRPALLDDFGLVPTLLWYFERYTARTGVRVSFRHAGSEPRLPHELETAAYRIMQEALTNVARHARTAEAVVRLWAAPEALYLQVADHGQGFDPDAALAAGASTGLGGMRERAEALGGRLTVEAKPGEGALVTAELPTPVPWARTEGPRP
jgi:PAS domain S-box-containing protein